MTSAAQFAKPPYTDEQLRNIREWQTVGIVHELTCCRCGSVLDVQRDGLHCPKDGYHQTWTYATIADGTGLRLHREAIAKFGGIIYTDEPPPEPRNWGPLPAMAIAAGALILAALVIGMVSNS